MIERRLEILHELDGLYAEDLKLKDTMKERRVLVGLLLKRKKELTCQIYMKSNIVQRIKEWEVDPEKAMCNWKQKQEHFKALTICRNEIIDSPTLQLPHPRAAERAFVLEPLAELWPDLVLPGQHSSVAALLRALRLLVDIAPL